jgi:site-specific recombinase XerD
MAQEPRHQRLGLDRIAFYRAWMEGTMDLGRLAARYLETGDDLRAARRTLKAIEHALIIACRRAGKPSDARLIRLNSTKLRALADLESDRTRGAEKCSALPSFEQYQQEVDPDGNWSIDELYQHYLDTHSEQLAQAEKKDDRRADRASRLIARRNALIIDLQATLAETPKPEHDIRGWLDESLSNRLASAGFLTIGSIIAHANQTGYYWYRSAPGLGQTKAQRVIEFIQRHEHEIGMSLTLYALTPPRDLPKTQKGARPDYLPMISAEQQEAPYFGPVRDGLYVPPEQLDGTQGLNRAPLEKNRSGASNDFEAIQRWLATFSEPHQAHTLRNYRKEAERLLLWAVSAKGMAFSSMTTGDVVEFRQFLSDPQPYEKWVSDRTYERYEPEWRPFVWRRPPRSRRPLPGAINHDDNQRKAGLSPESVRQSLSVCRALCSWLVDQRYLDYNPFLGISKGKTQIKVNTGRSFSRRQWAFIMNVLEHMDPSDIRTIRLRFILRLAYSTGLRLSEMVSATTDKITIEEDLGGNIPDAYFLTVLGKGNEQRSVPLPSSVRQCLSDYLLARGLNSEPTACEPGTPLIAKLYQTKQGWSLTPAALYHILSKFFDHVATQLPAGQNSEADYRRFFQASTHWLRHTYGTHALSYGADVNIVKENLGHKSLTTTSLYVQPERRMQLEQMEAFDRAVFLTDQDPQGDTTQPKTEEKHTHGQEG